MSCPKRIIGARARGNATPVTRERGPYRLGMLISSIGRPEHLDLFENGIAHKIDFAYAGPQSLRVAQLLEDKKLDSDRRRTASCYRFRGRLG